ncbi:MAG: PAS domain S-box protein [Deltaproteobacteria bacterium]|nr:PAS domain S-box protein [Deltaproteobacteria bacterium]
MALFGVDRGIHLVALVQELVRARDLCQIVAIVRRGARELTGADGATVVLREGEDAFYADEDAIAPLWKGRRLPMSGCIDGWVMTHREPVAIRDAYADPRIPHDALRPTFVKSLAVAPIRTAEPVGTIGAYWAEPRDLAEELGWLRALADATAVAIDNAQRHGELEERVRQRTAALELAAAELDAFARVANDLRSPLRGIDGFSAALLEDFGAELAPKARHYVDRVRLSAHRMSQLIENVLELSRVERGPMRREHVGITRIARDLAGELAEREPHRQVTVRVEEGLRTEGDAGLVRVLLHNLLANAWKFTQRADPARIDVVAGPGDGTFTVRDNGAGFDMAHAHRLFQPFARLHAERDFGGPGIGLSTVHRIVERHGGRIWAEATVDRGASFHFTLQRAAPEPQPVRAAPRLSRAPSVDGPFRALAEIATDGVLATDDTGVISYANAAAAAMFGGELVGRAITSLMPDRYRLSHLLGMGRFLETGDTRVIGRTLDLVGLHADGRELPIEVSIGSWTHDGRTTFTSIVRDLARRDRERERSQHHLALLDGVPDAVLTFDGDLVVRTWNRGAEEMYGWTALEAIGRHPSSFLAPEYLGEGSRADLLASLATKQRWQGEMIHSHKDGRRLRVFLSAAGILDDRGAISAIVSVNRDVSEHRLVEQASRRLVAIVESSGDAIISETLDGTIETWNRGAEHLYGATSAEMRGRSSRAIVPADRLVELERMVERVHGAGEVASIETRRVRKDGTEVDVAITMSPIFDAHGVVSSVSTIARDITEQRRLHEQVMLTGRMLSLGTLATGVAHEINNPLAIITLNLHTVEQEIQELEELAPGRIRELLAQLADARAGGERIRRTVLDLKTFSGADEERRRPLVLRRVLELATNLALNEIRHRARLVSDLDASAVVHGDEARLAQAFIALLTNAASAIPEGRAGDNEIHVVSRVEDGAAIIAIRDSGSGIPEEIRSRIFDPFFTTKPIGGGTGLGLWICHNIITSHGGEIGFHTEVGAGTTFRVRLPLAPSERAAEGPPQARAAAVHVARRRLLIVDDEPTITRTLGRILAREHDVVTASNGREALALFRGGERFDVILCDLMMPELTGMDLHAELRELAPDQVERMIFVSGGAFTPSARQFLETVPNLRLEKPVDMATLKALVRDFRRA